MGASDPGNSHFLTDSAKPSLKEKQAKLIKIDRLTIFLTCCTHMFTIALEVTRRLKASAETMPHFCLQPTPLFAST